MKSALLALALALAPLSAAAEEVAAGDLLLSGAFAFATPPSAQAGGAYVTIRNTGEAADRLVAAEAAFARTEIHTTEVDDQGVARMVELEDGIEIPPGGEVRLEPGAMHVMLMGLESPLATGEPRTVTLVFERAGPVEVSFDVVRRGEGGMGHGGHGGMEMSD